MDNKQSGGPNTPASAAAITSSDTDNDDTEAVADAPVGQWQVPQKVIPKKKKPKVSKRKVLPPVAERLKIAKMPFTSRSGKERLRPCPVSLTKRWESGDVSQSSCASDNERPCHSGTLSQKKGLTTKTAKQTDPVHLGTEVSQQGTEGSPCVSLSPPCEPPSTPVELQQEGEGLSCVADDVTSGESATEDESVVCTQVEASAGGDKKTEIFMPGHNTNKCTSYVWNYFHVDPDNVCIGICSLCRKKISRGKDIKHLGTTTLLRHLQRAHGKYREGPKIPDALKTSRGSPKLSSPLQFPLPTPSPSASVYSLVSRDGSADETIVLEESSPFKDSAEESLRAGSSADAAAAAGGRHSTAKCVKKSNYTTVKTQLTVEQCLARQTKYASSHPVARRISEILTALVVCNMCPLSLVDWFLFRLLMEVVCPRYRVPSRFSLVRNGIPDLYRDIKSKVIQSLKSGIGGDVHLTTDMWTSGSGQTKDYMSVTAHWVVESPPAAAAGACMPRQLIHRQATLCVTAFTKRHTAENLLAKLRNVIARWLTPHGLSSGFVITDNACNITKALQMGDFYHIPCFAHTINLVVQAFLKSDKGVQEVLWVARKISGHFRHSATACRRLHQLQEELKLPSHQLKQEVATRWNSTLHMLERMEEQQKAIHSYTTSHDFGRGGVMYLSPAHWKLISVLCKVLKPFEVATCEVSAETATLSQVIPLIRLLEKQLAKLKEEITEGPGAKYAGLVDRLLSCLLQDPRIVNILRAEHYILATVLDPRFKSYAVSFFPADTDLNTCKELLVSKLASELVVSPPSISEESARKKLHFPKTSSGEAKKTTQKPPTFDIWSGLSELPSISDTSSVTAPSDRVAMQRFVEDYFQDSLVLGMSESPLAYWRKKKAVWRPLYKLALYYLSCPPSSVYSERVFSAAGYLVGDRRRRLHPLNVAKIMFIKMNYHFQNEKLSRRNTQTSPTEDNSSSDELILCEAEDDDEDSEDVGTDESED